MIPIDDSSIPQLPTRVSFVAERAGTYRVDFNARTVTDPDGRLFAEAPPADLGEVAAWPMWTIPGPAAEPPLWRRLLPALGRAVWH